MPRPVPQLVRALAVIVACGSLSACVVGQPYGSSYSAQVYTTPAYRGYYGPGSGTGYGGYYAPAAYDYGYGGVCYTVPRVRWTPYGYRRVLVERCY